MPMGRITSEHEAALVQMNRYFGPAFADHAVIAITHALTPKPNQQLLTRDKILDQVRNLSPTHFLRTLVDHVSLRVVGVENKLEPMRSTSQIRLNQAILDTVADNENSRYDCSTLGQQEALHVNAEHAGGGSGGAGGGAEGGGAGGGGGGAEGRLAALQGRPQCQHKISRRADNKSVFEVVCESDSAIPQALAALMRSMQTK